MERIIVSRHPAAIKFIGRAIHPDWHDGVVTGSQMIWRPFSLEPDDPEYNAVYDSIRVVEEATPDDVRCKIVYGNLPLHLAVLATVVWALEFRGTPPRGAEYTLSQMITAGARLVPYRVFDLEDANEYAQK